MVKGMKNGRLGCGGLIVIILLVFAFLNDIASDVGESFQIFFWIGVIMQMEEKWEKADLTSWVVIVIMIRMVIKQVRADPEFLEE